ncbi:MAG TPA: hypothetical protein VHD32_18060 [Candidatus Didemnitutus sp.]|nr:hypothetical protein [Candidatus Didemnitutus sp.]
MSWGVVSVAARGYGIHEGKKPIFVFATGKSVKIHVAGGGHTPDTLWSPRSVEQRLGTLRSRQGVLFSTHHHDGTVETDDVVDGSHRADGKAKAPFSDLRDQAARRPARQMNVMPESTVDGIVQRWIAAFGHHPADFWWQIFGGQDDGGCALRSAKAANPGKSATAKLVDRTEQILPFEPTRRNQIAFTFPTTARVVEKHGKATLMKESRPRHHLVAPSAMTVKQYDGGVRTRPRNPPAGEAQMVARKKRHSHRFLWQIRGDGADFATPRRS